MYTKRGVVNINNLRARPSLGIFARSNIVSKNRLKLREDVTKTNHVLALGICILLNNIITVSVYETVIESVSYNTYYTYHLLWFSFLSDGRLNDNIVYVKRRVGERPRNTRHLYFISKNSK